MSNAVHDIVWMSRRESSKGMRVSFKRKGNESRNRNRRHQRALGEREPHNIPGLFFVIGGLARFS